MNLRKRFAPHHLVRKFQVGFFQRTAETAHAITVLPDVFPFRLIQNVADIRARVAARLDEGDEILDELLEKHVVLPQRVIGIDQKCVASHGDSCSATLIDAKVKVYFVLWPRQSTSLRASSAMAAAAPGLPMVRAASRILARRLGSSSNPAIFHAAAGKLLQRMAAPASSK